MCVGLLGFFFFQAEDGIRDFCLSRGLGDVYKRQALKTQKKIQLPFSENEMSNVLDLDNFEDNFTGARDRLIIDLFYTTGIRRIELIQLMISDVNINNKHIKVLGKRNKERIIPLIDSTINLSLIHI